MTFPARTTRWLLSLIAALGLTCIPLPALPGPVTVHASSIVPALTITEILANSNGDGTSIADAYEYVELKNNTASSIDLANYKFIFWWTPTQFVTWNMTASQTIPAGGVRVVWIKNTDAQGKTLANFNSHYGTSFTSSTLYTLDLGANGGLGNSGVKKLIVATDTGTEICIAKYNDRIYNSTTLTEDASVENSSIVYEYPDYLVDGNITMRMIDSNQKPTPGTIPAPPSIWITELLPNPSTASGDNNDAYEFIELYNNTAAAIDLAGYTVRYYWDYANPANYTDWNLTASKNIPAYGRMAVWLRGTQSSGKTAADFADHYNLPSTYFTSAQLYEVTLTSAQGMGNGGRKSVELRTDGGTAIVSATYNDGTADNANTTVDTTQDTSIVYGAPVDGTKEMRKLASTQYPTPGSKYNWFGGQMHAHTTYSDGVESGTPPTANVPQYAYAAAKAQGDFFGLSDHAEQIDDGDPTVTNGEWADIRLQADTATENYKFSGFPGWEITYNTTTAIWGHVNVFNTTWFADRWDTIDGRQYNLHDLWDDLAGTPEAIAQFNHPDYYWGDFEDFAYYNQAADDQTVLLEVNEDVQNGEKFASYIRALDRGWHVAPAWNGDNHTENWMADDNRTIVLAETNTRDSILDALRARRAYNSYGDRDIKLMFEINGQPMGSRLTNPGSALNVSVMAANTTVDPISKITLYGPGGQVIGSQTYSSRMAHYTASIPPQYAYYFVKVEQTDGDWALSAPIWVSDAPPMELTMSTQATAAAGVPVQVNASVKNTTGSTLSNVLVEFYKDDYNTPADNYSNPNKVGEVTLSSIAAGAASTASSTWAPAGGAGTYRLLVRATATVGGISKSVLSGIHLPELYITEIVGNSPGNTGVDNGFGDYYDEDYDFVEIYNNSKNDVNLKNYKLQDTYTAPYDIAVDFIIPAKSAKVVWIKKKNSTKTLANFNAAYGTSFAAGDVLQLQSSDVNSGLRFGGTTWVDLVQDADGKRIFRAKYNVGTDVRETHGPVGTHGTDPSVDGKALKYKYPVDGSLYLQKIGSNVTSTPGTVSADQLAP
ncbi:lamin tail domain-containing protein [Paenibacillus sp. HJGM_3]|uniref:lamin tail domain-containing protein n=1 Tax=Paenibacillus sp. HJGM_3 TaxID=3379816 RepID=UPI00385C7F80